MIIHEPDLQRIYYDAYYAVEKGHATREDRPTKHGSGLRAVWNAAIASVTPGGYATHAELATALGASPEDAAQFQTRVESLASGGPKIVPSSDMNAERGQSDAADRSDK